jgi:hypothetical protein
MCFAQSGNAADVDFADVYDRLVFDVCVPVVAREPNVTGAKPEYPGFVVTGPRDVGTLASFLKLQSTDKYYLVSTADQSVSNTVRAFFDVTGKSCTVVARDLPGIQGKAVASLNDVDGNWHIQFKKQSAIIHIGQAQEAKLQVSTIMSSGKADDTLFTMVRKTDDPIPVRISADNMSRWVKGLIDVCSAAGMNKRFVADNEVAEFFERTPSTAGKPQLKNKTGFPFGMLFTGDDKSKPCQFMGAAGYGETQQIFNELQAELSKRGATVTDKPTKIKSNKLMLPKPIDAKRSTPQIIVSYSDLIEGSAAMVSFWAN